MGTDRRGRMGREEVGRAEDGGEEGGKKEGGRGRGEEATLGTCLGDTRPSPPPH